MLWEIQETEILYRLTTTSNKNKLLCKNIYFLKIGINWGVDAKKCLEDRKKGGIHILIYYASLQIKEIAIRLYFRNC